MTSLSLRAPVVALSCAVWACALRADPPPPSPAAAEIVATAAPSDWRTLDPERTLYLELAAGRVVIELAPEFAPRHVANVKALAREGYFDGLAIVRSQENYVAQWGDPAGDDETQRKPMKIGVRALPGEYLRKLDPSATFVPLVDGDVYAREVGFINGLPVARDPQTGTEWLAHCYAMLGAGRGDGPDSGSGAELYVVTGHAPRHLDKNVTLLGRVVRGMEYLTTLPRGSGALGFYERPEQYVPIRSLRVAADLPAAERTELELLRTDTPTFRSFVEARRTRRESWFLDPAGRIELCNVPLPVRAKPTQVTP